MQAVTEAIATGTDTEDAIVFAIVLLLITAVCFLLQPFRINTDAFSNA